MISSYKGDSIWISNLEEKEEEESFDGVEAAIDKVAFSV